MNFGEWSREHFAEPHAIDEECLEAAFNEGYEEGIDYIRYGGTFR